jgi:hypothetical protein
MKWTEWVLKFCSFFSILFILSKIMVRFFWTGLQDFSGLTGLGFNHDNPEKSCNPV